jgi:hypothetical protein
LSGEAIPATCFDASKLIAMESAMSKLGAVSDVSEHDQIKRRLDAALDEQLENTFPASDPLKIVLPQRNEKPAPHDDSTDA